MILPAKFNVFIALNRIILGQINVNTGNAQTFTALKYIL